VCFGYRDLARLSLAAMLTVSGSAAMLTVSGRDYVHRLTHDIGAELDCRDSPGSALMLQSLGPSALSRIA
jgi:hypothetical protein